MKYPIPQNIRQLRSYQASLDITDNFLRFDKPLTEYLGEDNGKSSRRMSTKTPIQLEDPAVKPFNELKDNLIEQVELVQSDYK